MTDDEKFKATLDEIDRRNYEQVNAELWKKLIPPPPVSPLSGEPLLLTHYSNVDALLGKVVEELETGIRFCVVGFEDGDPIVEVESGDIPPKRCDRHHEVIEIVERNESEALNAIWPHVEQCIFCQIEVAIFQAKIEANQPNPLVEIAKDFLVGCLAFACWGLFQSARGVTDVYNQRIYDQGGTPPPWFKPRR